MKNKPELTFRRGNRVDLRILCEEDAPLLVTWMNDHTITQYLASRTPITVEAEIEWIKKGRESKDSYNFGIETKEGELIGCLGFGKIDMIDGTAQSGACIGNKKFWGKGFGTEAKMLLLDFAFNTLNIRKMCSGAIAFNKRSIAYQKKCGGVIEGTLNNQRYVNGRYWDEILFAVYKDDWVPLWEKYKKEHKIAEGVICGDFEED